MDTSIAKVLTQFNSISLEEMDKVKLFNRTDTKFIFNTNQLFELLTEASATYQILEINEQFILDYRNQYFDTENFDLYLNHHNTKLNRYKLRQREYVFSNLSFFEIKLKSNKGRTLKMRLKTDSVSSELNPEKKAFIQTNTSLNPDDYIASIISKFSRITLVHKQKNEKITIDFQLKYEYQNQYIELPFIAIAEVKRNGFETSEFISILKKHKIYPHIISKYCIGTLLLNKHLKYNRFKEQLLILKKIANNDHYNLILDRY